MTSIVTMHQMVKDKFGYDVHYEKIWEAKRKAIIKAFGDWDESYQALPKLMNILKLTCNTPKYTLVVFDMFRVFCKHNLTVS